MKTYAFWNNKGGTGKTSVAFQAICFYAQQHPKERILVVDACPQANLSELFLGGLEGQGSTNLFNLLNANPRRSIGGYFQSRLPTPFTAPTINPATFLSVPATLNTRIPQNIQLLAGDPLVELQTNAIATLANSQIPGSDPWIAVVDWLNDFLSACQDGFSVVFIDSNPSFSIYTQIALAAAQRLVLPVMADDSSRRAIQNAFALVHGVNLPSPMYQQYSFNQRLSNAGRSLPRVHLVAKNRLTQYMGAASAYSSVLISIDQLLATLLAQHPSVFTFAALSEGLVEIRDFQTTGVVAFAEGTPFTRLTAGNHSVQGRTVQVNQENIDHCIASINGLVARL